MSKEPIYGPASFKNWPPKNNKSAVHPHLTKLSKDYKQTDDLQKAVTAFLSIDDGGYDSIEQAFRCGANFGLYHYIKHSPLPEAQPLEGAKFSHPFRVGRKQNRAVLDANGIEVVVFRKGLQDMAMNYCNMLNAQFATDAGGGKESELREALQQATDFIQQWAQKPNEFELLKRCKSLLTAPSTHSSSEMAESPDWTQQDLTFKVSELIEHSFDVKYARTDTLINAYQIESSLHSIIDSLGLELVIKDRSKFECNLGGAFEL